MEQEDYYNRVNRDLLRLIPPDAKVVVEVGCGAGALARAYRRINPDVMYLGIELDEASAQRAVAGGGLDRVVSADAEAVEPAMLGLPGDAPLVDCLVLGDVLEHMVDPWAVLRKLAGWLREGGQVVACIPNVQHFSMILNLLHGRWRYKEEGLLDRTHLRFFTREGVEGLFAAAGLHVFDIITRWVDVPGFESFVRAMQPALGPLGIDPATFAAQTEAYQYVVRGVRGPGLPQRMLIWSLLGSVIGSEVRIHEPHRFLATIPGVRVVTGNSLSFADLDRTAPGELKVVVQQRVIISLSDHVRLQRELLRREYLIVAEFDDDPLHFDALVASDYFALRSCHCVQTTTEALATTLRAYHPHVRVFPNQIAELPPSKDPRRSAPGPAGPRRLFFGALNRQADWRPIMPALNALLNALRGQVHVQVVFDHEFFEALETGEKSFEPLCSFERYHELLDEADIALLPLEPTRFNQHKSDLKFLDSAAHSVAALASPTVYSSVIRPGENGLLYHSPDEFAEGLERLVAEPDYARRLADAAHAEVARDRLLARDYRRRWEWYLEMLGRWPELTRDLTQRVPGLRG